MIAGESKKQKYWINLRYCLKLDTGVIKLRNEDLRVFSSLSL